MIGAEKIPFRCGKIKEKQWKKFDGSFFSLPNDIANATDPVSRILSEKTFEAIVDAGTLPSLINVLTIKMICNINKKDIGRTHFYSRNRSVITHVTFHFEGYNPSELKGTKTGVYVGILEMEYAVSWLHDDETRNAFGYLGSSRFVVANRISYWLGVTGKQFQYKNEARSKS